MRRELAVAVIGAGGSYTPELVSGVLAHRPEELPIGELRLCDINAERLDVMAGLTRRMISASGREIRVRTAAELHTAVDGVDFVVTQIRVGGMPARHLDESIPLRYGIIGQETTGPGGMAKALRTVPVMVDIANEVARLAPEATILNYTNPSGIMAEAVLNHTDARFVGLCAGIPGLQAQLHERLSAKFGTIETACVGLNHVGFVHRVVAGGEDVTPDAIGEIARQAAGGPEWWRRWAELAQAIGAFPMPGYSEYYFRRSAALERQRSAALTRAQQVIEIEQAVFAEAADPATTHAPEALAKRGGEGYSSVTFAVLKAMLADRGDRIVMSVLNGDAVHGLPADASVEVVCEVDGAGARPLPIGAMPLSIRGIVQAVKAHETLTIEAALTRRRDVALQALLAHPLVGDLDVAEPLLDELLEAHGLDYT